MIGWPNRSVEIKIVLINIAHNRLDKNLRLTYHMLSKTSHVKKRNEPKNYFPNFREKSNKKDLRFIPV